MSRINMKVGITAEQVNEANAAYAEYRAALDGSVDGPIDASVIDQAIALMNEAADKLSATLGDDHIATRRVSDASIRAREALEKIIKNENKYYNKLDKLRAKVRSYNGWFVIINNVRVPIVLVKTVDGLIAYEGENHPFIPVYYPGTDSEI